MNMDEKKHLLSAIPGVDRVFESLKGEPPFEKYSKNLLVESIRGVTSELRTRLVEGPDPPGPEELTDDAIRSAVEERILKMLTPNLRRVINGTGVVVHTNLGRSPLSEAVMEHLLLIATRYSNLEYNLDRGERGSRYSAVEELICELSGAEAALVVNNNAGAVLLSLETLARDRQVIISRGELVEIGGSFRIPDVMLKSGAILREVGTTNRTHLKDYEEAIGPETGLLLKVHTSNYHIIGFTKSVSAKDLVRLGKSYSLPVMEDLGSGTLVDFSRYGLTKEPTVQEAIGAGIDIVTFSGDKLLGGPQAGIIAGKAGAIERIKKNPLTRALRIDKLTLAALEGTLRFYRDEQDAVGQIPTLKMIMMPIERVRERARLLSKELSAVLHGMAEVSLLDGASKTGGGALPQLDIPSVCVRVRFSSIPVSLAEKMLREQDPSVIARVEDDALLLDVRTIFVDEMESVCKAFKRVVN